MSRVIGLLGGSGAGKSTAARILEEKGALVIDADKVSHDLTSSGGEACAAVAEVFGPEYLTPDGAMDRRKMGNLVFSSPTELAKLESILHPLMREQIQSKIQGAKQKIVVLDCAVLLKPRFRDLVDEMWLVTAPAGARSARIQARDGLSPLQAQARINAQTSEDEMRDSCNHVIENSGDTDGLRKQIESIL